MNLLEHILLAIDPDNESEKTDEVVTRKIFGGKIHILGGGKEILPKKLVWFLNAV